MQKQPPEGVLKKRYSENMLQIYRRTSMPKCDFNKVALQLYLNHTSAWVFSWKFAAYFRNIFSYEHFWVTASEYGRLYEASFTLKTSLHCHPFQLIPTYPTKHPTQIHSTSLDARVLYKLTIDCTCLLMSRRFK